MKDSRQVLAGSFVCFIIGWVFIGFSQSIPSAFTLGWSCVGMAFGLSVGANYIRRLEKKIPDVTLPPS